jgi:hypothetical protein
VIGAISFIVAITNARATAKIHISLCLSDIEYALKEIDDSVNKYGKEHLFEMYGLKPIWSDKNKLASFLKQSQKSIQTYSFFFHMKMWFCLSFSTRDTFNMTGFEYDPRASRLGR